MGRRIIKVLTNFHGMWRAAQKYTAERNLEVDLEDLPGKRERFRAIRTFVESINASCIILNVETALMYRLCALRYIWPWSNCVLVSVDLILRAPVSAKSRVLCKLKAILFRKVDYFILYHRDADGYRRHFGIPREKCIYVPFKVNGIDRIREIVSQRSGGERNLSDGDYVLTVGRSLRDIDTFVKAMRKAKLPGVILRQEGAVLRIHGTSYESKGTLPDNVEEIVDDGSYESFIKRMVDAAIVVIPRFANDINATGISVYLQAMALGKCVIISHGPGATELLQDGEAIVVPAEDADELAGAIVAVWENEEYRRRVAKKGQEYALSLGDENRLIVDIFRASIDRALARKAID